MTHPHSNLTKITDNQNINTSALAAVTGILSPSKIDASRLQGFRSVQQKGIIQFFNSDGSGGPLAVYLIEPGLTLAEAEEAIEADPQSSMDVPAIEHLKRKIWFLGFTQRDSSGGGSEWTEFKTNHKISVIEGVALNYMVYNTNQAAALDAANSVLIFCEHLGVWLRD